MNHAGQFVTTSSFTICSFTAFTTEVQFWPLSQFDKKFVFEKPGIVSITIANTALRGNEI